ncbi:uncharacterized protein LOC124445165 [Xenia sp. Carnegie-2017]|uniref:uncharacterized protein LOC124445165 n=1 Tax=Xenia sp. Carnegie-2017 TaxID=2897299 RepID=UPI001F04491C|nr:uncharacterized protein LOC124445165 [Xenia sp. Carnegie-2017]
MEESNTLKNGRIYLGKDSTIILGISPGNPQYHNVQNLKSLFDFAQNHSTQKILLFLTDKISEHNYRAIGSSNPERSARVKANRVRNKCNETICLCNGQGRFQFINWSENVEVSGPYIDALTCIKRLYEENYTFQKDVVECTKDALLSLKNGREKASIENGFNLQTKTIDLEEGVNYLLKELAFLSVVNNIYHCSESVVLVYHKRWPVLEKYFDGGYDNISKPFLGFHVMK